MLFELSVDLVYMHVCMYVACMCIYSVMYVHIQCHVCSLIIFSAKEHGKCSLLIS